MPDNLLKTQPIGLPVLGIIIPALIFIIAFTVTWLLYRHFAKKSDGSK